MPRDAGIPSETELELMSLVVRKRTGQEIRRLYKEHTGREISPGTMFTAFRRLKDRDWVEVESDYDEDGRVKSFKLVRGGVAALNRGREHYQRVASFGLSLGNELRAARAGGDSNV